MSTNSAATDTLVSRTRCNAPALLRRAGTRLATEHGAERTPALQRITPQVRRAALRPGHGFPHVTAFTT
ncbi:hypothetical protein TM239_28220 [Bradyrhizobium sp. TM239]|nr:hypothetical protein TM239_28220 [Bradyrhizobium sp. TM239]